MMILIIISYVGWRALTAATSPPRLNGNPISIANLHRQLTSPMSVLANALGDTPLAMKVLFNGQDEGRVQFDLRTDSALRDDDESLVEDNPKVVMGSRGSDAVDDDAGYERNRFGYREGVDEEEASTFIERQQTSSRDPSPSPELQGRRYSWNK